MTETSGWTPAGIASLVAIIAGIGLLVAYMGRRGLHQGDLDGTDETATEQAAADPTAISAPRSTRRSAGRPLGALGAILLVVGLALGVMVATGTWGTSATTTTPAGATGPQDCAAGWSGCPQATAPTQP
jgi:hypothetical protein